jgi:predicted ATP-dependent endonuclease of OLD family
MIIIKAILKINSNAKFAVKGTDIDTCEIEWHNGTTPISKADIEAQFTAVEFDMAMEDLRAKRNKDLQDSDWTQLPDNTLTSEQRNAWMQFRTELRNITDGLTTVEQVNNIDYPDKP